MARNRDGWVQIETNHDSVAQYLAVDEIAAVKVAGQNRVSLRDRSGTVYQWKTDGTMAEYASLVKLLGLTDVA